MKKFIAWLTNRSKIGTILTHIYRGLFVATKSLNTAIQALSELQPGINPKLIATLNSVAEYLATATKAVEAILGWLCIEPKLDSAALLAEDSKPVDGVETRDAMPTAAALREVGDKIAALL